MEWCGMNIEWTLCSERMPPDDRNSRCIFTNLEFDKAIPLIYSGHTTNMLGHIKGDA